jgi:hypothetical protein
MEVALVKLAEEDPTFRVHTNNETGQTIIAGVGELQLDVLVTVCAANSASKSTSANLRSTTVRRSVKASWRSRRPLHQADRRPWSIWRRVDSLRTEPGQRLRIRRCRCRWLRSEGVHQADLSKALKKRLTAASSPAIRSSTSRLLSSMVPTTKSIAPKLPIRSLRLWPSRPRAKCNPVVLEPIMKVTSRFLSNTMAMSSAISRPSRQHQRRPSAATPRSSIAIDPARRNVRLRHRPSFDDAGTWQLHDDLRSLWRDPALRPGRYHQEVQHVDNTFFR